mmetsp:Transcript_16576/g.16671  ORF Transcript_16576/g.16671 Transcript_16576/m.16671 type:complete len:119 (+) Transcript_16576:377-733(+)
MASQPKFMGRQPTFSRVPEKPMVLYEKGGSDFRCSNTSSLGRQALSKPSMRTSERMAFSQASRFGKSETIGPGPNMAQPSAVKRQILSQKVSAGNPVIGTSTRDSALKLYSLHTSHRR